MKPRVTRKSIKEAYSQIISVGDCDLHDLLWYEEPRAYTAGIYGWNADVYEFGGTAIVTGYRPFGDRPSYDLIQRYESAAKEVLNGGLPYEDERDRLHVLIRDFIQDAVKGVK